MKVKNIPQLIDLGEKSGLNMAIEKREMYEMEQMMKHNIHSCFIAKSRGQIIGMVFGAYNGRRGWVYHLAVHPKWKDQGLGSLLLQKTEAAFVEQGATKIMLGIGMNNLETVSFYKKNGFQILNDAVLMEKDLWRGGE